MPKNGANLGAYSDESAMVKKEDEEAVVMNGPGSGVVGV